MSNLLLLLLFRSFKCATFRRTSALSFCFFSVLQVDNLIFEYSPGVAERSQDWGGLYEANPKALARWVQS